MIFLIDMKLRFLNRYGYFAILNGGCQFGDVKVTKLRCATGSKLKCGSGSMLGASSALILNSYLNIK